MFLLGLVLLLCVSNSTIAFEIGRGAADPDNSLPPPRLIYPITETADITGKNSLQFQWRWGYAATVDHYDFRLYKGYNTTADNLMLKEQLPATTSQIAVGAEKFDDGQVYTWVLKQVSLSGVKSDTSSNSFKVIKK